MKYRHCRHGLQRLRHLLLLFVATFVLNFAGAAARASVLSEARHAHSVLELAQAGLDVACPEANAAPCDTHCLQEAKRAEQKATVDAPLPVAAPPTSVVHAAWRPDPPLPRVDTSRHIVGLSPTLLFGHRRN